MRWKARPSGTFTCLENVLSTSRNMLWVAEVKGFEFLGQSQASTSEFSAKFFKMFYFSNFLNDLFLV
eukprot:UN04628